MTKNIKIPREFNLYQLNVTIMGDERLREISMKLGIKAENVIRKAAEFQQLMDIRVTSSSLTALGLTGSCPSLICLNMAATVCGQTFDKSEALRLSGVNKKIYLGGLNAVESMLGIYEQKNIKDFAVSFGCHGAVKLAEEILKSYKDQCCADMDFTTPMFQTSALYCACKKLKLKIDRTKILELCGVNRKTFDKLVCELDKHAEILLEKKKIKSPDKLKRPLTLIDEVEKQLEENETLNKQQKIEQEEGDINYEDWKRKMLEKASRMKAMKANSENSPKTTMNNKS